jgi:hypothetical protein
MLPSQDIQWAQFAPDAGPYSSQFSDAILNVEPRIDGYGPLPKLATIGTAVPARVIGAYASRRSNGSTDLFCGTTTKLYRYNIATASWDDVTRSVGGDYTTPDGYYWNFAQFGGRLIACNGFDATQYIDVDGAGTNFAALTNAPIARYVQTVGDFLMFGNLSTDINAIAWSGINDSEYYTYGFRGSDLQTFPDGGFIQGIVPYGAGAVIFQRDKIRLLERISGNLIFAVRVLHENIGCFAPQSIVRVRNDFFWYDQGGFYRGVEAQPIGAERVNRYTVSEADSVRLKYMRGGNDPVKQVVWWVIDTSSNTTIMLGYDWGLDRWTQSTEACDFIFPAITPGYTMDAVDTVFGTMDEVTIPWDSSFWTGSGVLALAGFTYAGAFGYFQGFSQAATLETNDFEVNPGNYGYIQSARHISDAAYSSATFQLGHRAFHGQAITWPTAVTPSSSTGRAFLRKRGKTHRIRVNIAANASWSVSNGVTVYARGAGGR